MISSTPQKYGWRGQWIGWRNRLLASPRFQRFASRFPLTRPIARRRARALFDLVAGFTYSQILAACIETDLFEVLAEGPQTSEVIASRIDLPLAGAERLLRGAAALGLVEPIEKGWALGSDGAALRGNRGIAEMVAHHHLLYADLADPVGLLRRGGGGGALSGLWHYAESPHPGDARAVAAYSALMAASQPLIAAQAIDAYPFHRHRRLLDVGGGEGAFLAEVGARAPALELGLFDLPAVGDRARVRFDSAGLTKQPAIFGGDFLRDPLPQGYDIISLVRVLHDHDDGPALELLRNIYNALPSGGTLLIVEPMARTPGAAAAGDAYFGFYLLAMGSGRPRSASEIAAMLRSARFSQTRQIATAMPLTTSAMAAVR
ncbi:demethylspheroidene O-methyltransferase [Sphingomonas vulcanisoli]|uniref:Demethylspheroidene O-methyltransferase n=1 Tax=Sphingomonas vulcanisoli TaxID=1658060 RepID=A0ABX0TXF5_9SPHN|nr:methyltransferase [Sphingomonas vulcanisoli]NIJ08455.1 demethylspheroidene O-methyltransferase [Sphingomonas vulcanisoli]